MLLFPAQRETRYAVFYLRTSLCTEKSCKVADFVSHICDRYEHSLPCYSFLLFITFSPETPLLVARPDETEQLQLRQLRKQLSPEGIQKFTQGGRL